MTGFIEGLTSRKAAPQKTLTPNHMEFSMTSITLKSTKQQIIDEAVPLIEDQAEQIQTLTEKLNAALILLGITAATAALF